MSFTLLLGPWKANTWGLILATFCYLFGAVLSIFKNPSMLGEHTSPVRQLHCNISRKNKKKQKTSHAQTDGSGRTEPSFGVEHWRNSQEWHKNPSAQVEIDSESNHCLKNRFGSLSLVGDTPSPKKSEPHFSGLATTPIFPNSTS